MTRKLKVLGLALVAVLAIGAMAASAAQAAPELISEGEVEVAGEGTGGGLEGQEFLSAFGKKVECEKSDFSTPLTKVPTSTVTVTPNYTPSCFVGGKAGLPATVTMNGCDYLFHLTEAVAGKEHEYEVHVDLVCPTGKEVEIHVYANKAEHEKNNSICTLKIPPQTGLTSATVKAKTTTGKNFGDLEIYGTVKGIKATQERKSEILCPKGTETNTAEYSVSSEHPITVTFKDKNGNPVDVDIK